MRPPLSRLVAAEFLGTAGLVCAVVGSGIAAERLSPGAVGLQLLENSIATALALVALICAFGAVSGAHFNPVVTAVAWLRGRTTLEESGAYVAAQVAGGVAGAVLANVMFERPALELAARVRTGMPLWIGEVVATTGLLLTIEGTLASNAKAVPYAVAAHVGAAYWFTSSTAFANPAVALARAFSDSFAGIALRSVPGFVVAEAVGACLGVALLGVLFPTDAGRSRPGNPAE